MCSQSTCTDSSMFRRYWIAFCTYLLAAHFRPILPGSAQHQLMCRCHSNTTGNQRVPKRYSKHVDASDSLHAMYSQETYIKSCFCKKLWIAFCTSLLAAHQTATLFQYHTASFRAQMPRQQNGFTKVFCNEFVFLYMCSNAMAWVRALRQIETSLHQDSTIDFCVIYDVH